MAGYTRQSTFTDGDVIQASDSNNEFDALLDAFNNSTGHAHDGTAAEGPVIGLIGDAGVTTPLNKIVIDTVNDRIGFFVDVASSAVEQIRIQDGAFIPVTNNDVDLGSASLKFKDGYFAGNLTVDGNITLGGDITLGDADTDTITIGAEVDSHVVPNTDDTYDLGSASKEWRNLYIDGTANIDSLVADTADINGGTIDGAAVGGTTPAAGAFTTLSSTGAATVGTTLGVTGATTLSSTLGVTGTATFSGAVSVEGNTTLGNAATDTVTFTADVASNVIPSVDSTYTLGDASNYWAHGYLDAITTTGNVSLGGTLGVTGATTLSSTLGVTGTTTVGNLTATGTVDLSAATVSDGGTVTTIDIDGGTIDDVILRVQDASVFIEDNLDNTKIAQFQASGITTGTTRTFTFPDATGTLVLQDDTATLTNKSINLANNTLTGTLTEFNTALSGDSFVSLTGTETLTNKTLTSPTIDLSTVTSSGDLAVADGGTGASTAADARTNLDVDQAGTALALAIALS